MKPHFLKKTLSPALQQAALLLMDDCIAMMWANSMIKAKTTFDSYSEKLKKATEIKTRTLAILMVIVFGMVSFHEIIEIIPDKWHLFIKLLPKGNT